MRRREFLRVILGAAVCATVGAPGSAKDVRELNYERFRQRLEEIASNGAVITSFSLAAPRNGSRTALVHIVGRKEPLRFEQQWEGDCI